MRISTSQIFDAGARGIGSNQYDLFKLQNQLSTGRKVLTPEDDPIAAAQALVLTQTQSVSSQFLKNQDDASGKLGIVDNQLTALNDLLQNVRERVVQAGNTTLSNADRSYIAQELEARFSELLGIANSQDGAGNYLFSGYQGAVKPYSVNSTGAAYAGDNGKRLLQVDGSRQIPTNISGSELFGSIRNGNGTFVTATGGNTAGGINQGTGIIDQGSITNPTLWDQALASNYGDVEIRFSQTAGVTQYQLFDTSTNTALSTAPLDFTAGQSISLGKTTSPAQDFGVSVTIEGTPLAGDTFRVMPSTSAFSASPALTNTGVGQVDQTGISDMALWNKAVASGYGDIQIRFTVTGTGTVPDPFVTTYQLFDKSSGSNLGAALPYTGTALTGQNIPLSNTALTPADDFGAYVVLSGVPANGDVFDITPTPNGDIFTTLRNTINTLTQGIGSAAGGNSSTEFANDLAGNLQNIDQALENVTKARTTVGSHLKELDSLNNTGQDLQLQYASSLSSLQDLDWAKAITDMSRKQMQLEAAQLSFKQTSQLSLFSIL